MFESLPLPAGLTYKADDVVGRAVVWIETLSCWSVKFRSWPSRYASLADND